MPTAFQMRTLPEIISQMFATLRVQLGDDVDLSVGSPYRAILEAAGIQDAEQYVQMHKLTKLRDIKNLKGEDLDQAGVEFGSNLFEEFRRRQARTSLVDLVVGDGTVWKTTTLVSDVAALSTTFGVADGSAFPVSGAVVVERGTAREETVVVTRSGDVFTIISPTTGFVNPHLINGRVETLATTSVLAAAALAGTAAATLQAGTETAWPANGSVIFERDTVQRETKTFTRVGTALTLGSNLGFTHAIGTKVILSTAGVDRNVAAGSIAYVPETVATKRISFRVRDAGVLYDGDYSTGLIRAESEGVGSDTKVGANVITRWQAEPFVNATVINPSAAQRGRDRENDDSYSDRLIQARIARISCHVDAVAAAVSGETDPFSGRTVEFAQGVPPVVPGTSYLYITDGSVTFVPDYQIRTGRDVVISDARVNEQRGRLNAYGPFLVAPNPLASRTPRLFKSSERGVATLVGANFLEDNTKAWVVNAYAGYWLKTDDNQFYQITSNTAIRLTVTAGGATPSLGSYSVTDFAADPLEPGVDYVFNEATGELELTTVLTEHDSLVAADDGALPSVGAYTYTRGLVAYVQRLVNGDMTDRENFPGLNASGTKIVVVVPTIITPQIQIQVVAAAGVIDANLIAIVKAVIQAYINSLGIGQQVILAEIVRLVKSLSGVANCKVLSPSSDVSVAAGQLPRVADTDIEVV